MIYVILTYIFSPLLYLFIALKNKENIARILVIQTAKIGDLICSTPVFRGIKKKYPEAQLTVMANPAAQELLKFNPYVSEIIIMKPAGYAGFTGKLKLANFMCKGKYDIVVCLNPNVPFAIAALWGLVPVRLSIMPDFSGLTFKLASVFFTSIERHVRGRLVMDTYIQMLRRIGIGNSNLSKEVYKSAGADKKVQQILQEDKHIIKVIPVKTGIQKTDELDSCLRRNDNVCLSSGQTNNPLIGIAVSSGNKLKELGAEKIAGTINALLNDFDIYIVLIGSNQDKNTAQKVIDSVTKKDRILDTTGLLNLSELPALIERLLLFIGVDTGIAYMADALSVPVIDIAGPSDMDDQRPTGSNCIIIKKDLPCIPCSHAFSAPYSCKRGDRLCITSVSAAEIVEAVKRFLN
ncbi:MAG: glycosyltransferase family 9 protein [Nitrospirae bacterium]|nr:glycosyltransferase family 9 protein [Nitrospirota bacterium]